MGMRGVIILFSVGLISTVEAGTKSRSEFEVEPVIGYERVVTLIPTLHTTDRLTYGARVRAGLPLLAVEAEYTRGSSSETYTAQDLATKDTADKAKLGLRSTLSLGKLLSFNARAGAQASRNTHEQTTGGVTTTTEEAMEIHPYAGAGLTIKMGKKVAFNAEVVTVFRNFSRFEDNEYQATAGFILKVP